MDERVDRPDVEHAPVSRGPMVVRRSRTRWFVGLIVLLLAGLAAWWFWPHHATQTAGRGAPGRGGEAAPQPVGAETIGTGDIRIILNELGTVTSLATVTVQTQINGQLTEVGFKEGQIVKAGDFLAQIDPRPYQVALEQAQGTLAKDQALLAAGADRPEALPDPGEAGLDRAAAGRRPALPGAQYQGAVQTDQAQIDSAKLNLAYCHIVSPIDRQRRAAPGRSRQLCADQRRHRHRGDHADAADLGDLLGAEDNLPQIMQRLRSGATLPVEAYDRANTSSCWRPAQLASVDNQIDTTTGTVKLRAMFRERGRDAVPQPVRQCASAGEYAARRGARSGRRRCSTARRAAYVYVINARQHGLGAAGQGRADRRRLQAQVLSGLQPGERVVTDGTDRLRDGAEGDDTAAAGAERRRRERTGALPAAQQHRTPAADSSEPHRRPTA